MKKILMISLLALSGCAVDKCNDYYVAYECKEQYGEDCVCYYNQMCNECKGDE